MFSGKNKIFKQIFAVLCGGLFLGVSVVGAAQGNVNVQMNVPAGIICGNGIVEAGETCDDGNVINNDGCSSACLTEGGGVGVTDNNPIIMNVASSTLATSAVVSWVAVDDKGIASVNFDYGQTMAFGTPGIVVNQSSTNLAGLVKNTVYNFKITAIDTAGHSVEYVGSFKTKLLPLTISDVIVTPGINSADIDWTTNEAADSQVVYGLTIAYGNSITDPARVLAHNTNLPNLLPNTTYHFKLFSTSEALESAETNDAVFTTLKDATMPPDVSNFNATANGNSILLTWVNPPLAGTPDFSGVRILRKIGSRSNDINDGLLVYTGAGQAFTDNNVVPNTDYFYTAFSFDTSFNYSPGVSDNASIAVVPGGAQEICGNGLDDNANGLVDCADPACAVLDECRAGGGGILGKIDVSQLLFYVGNGLIRINPEYRDALGRIVAPEAQIVGRTATLIGLSGTDLTIGVPKWVLNDDVRNISLKIGSGGEHAFSYDAIAQAYFTKILFPLRDSDTATLHIDYMSGDKDAVEFNLKALPHGVVADTEGRSLKGAIVTLFNKDGSLFDAGRYGELNPQLTDGSGKYGWVVPNDLYMIKVEDADYFTRDTGQVGPVHNVLNSNLSLVLIPPKILEGIEPGDISGSARQIGSNILKNAGTGLNLGLQKIDDWKNDPEAQNVASNMVAPAAVGLTLAGLLALVSWADLLNLLQFLFLQPLLLLGRRKREKWGIVYNSLNKLPIDLATVRLIDLSTGKIIQSKVTDADGRYFFSTKPGNYRITVFKNGLVFPSVILKEFKDDGEKLDIYHGEVIEVTEVDSQITANIPLDPIGVAKTPLRMTLQRVGRRAHYALAMAGFFITLVTLYISPRWYVWVILVLHIVLFFLFRRLTQVPKPKGWGIVYDENSKKPVSRVIARLFDSQFNKLVDTEFTDRNGRYSFLVGGNRYYVTFERKGYEQKKTEIIDLTKEKKGMVAVDVWLKTKTA